MLDEELFQDFIEHRKYIKKPMSPVAEKRMRKRLERLEDEGYLITQMVEKAITNGWQDVWPKEEDKRKIRPVSHSDRPLPDYGERTEPTQAREQISNIRQLVRR